MPKHMFYQQVNCIVVEGFADNVEPDLSKAEIGIVDLKSPETVHSARLTEQSSREFTGNHDSLIQLNCFVFVTFKVPTTLLDQTVEAIKNLKYIRSTFFYGTPHQVQT